MFAFSENILNINKINEEVSGKPTSIVNTLATPQSFWSEWLVFILTIGVIFVVLFFIYRFIRYRGFSSSGSFLTSLDTLYLDNNTKISIVKVGNNYYLIGHNSNSIVNLGKIEDESLIENIGMNFKTTRTFKDIFLSKTTKNFTLEKAKDRLKKLK